MGRRRRRGTMMRLGTLVVGACLLLQQPSCTQGFVPPPQLPSCTQGFVPPPLPSCPPTTTHPYVSPRHTTAVSSTSPAASSPSPPPATRRPAGYKFIQYDGEAISKLAVREPWRLLSRFGDVGLPILSWLTLVNVDEMMGQSDSDARRRVHAKKLREMLVSLGPVFIKIGQALSNRPDIVGPIYVKELEKLQDTVGPFPDSIAYQIIEAELGRPANEVFDFVGGTSAGPVASASLCQVYKAKVRATGELVAVKVQRPNIFKTAEADLAILRAGASYLQKSRKLRTDLKAIVDEFGETLWEELDFIHEGENCKKFKSFYAAPVLEGIVAPDVLESLTTKRVLTMSWVEGTKLPWGEDSERLIGLGLECSTYQLLERGFLHSDPHAGNLLRTPQGELAYLDHGMMTQITEEQRYALIKSVSYLFNKEFDKLAGTFVDLGFVSEDGDPSALEGFGPALRAAFTNASASGESSLLDLNFARLSSNIQDVAFRYPIRIPPYWSLVIRCLAILEGIALQNNPRFRVVSAVYPFILKYLLQSSGTPALRLALQEILLVPVEEPPDRWGEVYTRPGRIRYKIRWSRLERMLEASSRPVTELLNPPTSPTPTAGGSPPPPPPPPLLDEGGGSSLVNNQETLDLILTYILSPNGAFLREALIEDILGALDDANLVVLRGLSLLSGGLLAPPTAYPDRDRLAVIASLLNNFRKLATDRGFSSSLPSPTQSQALVDLSRQVLAAYAERQASATVRAVFHRYVCPSHLLS